MTVLCKCILQFCVRIANFAASLNLETKMELKKLTVRTLSGIIYCGIIVGCILIGHEAVAIMASALATIAAIEFSKINSDLNARRIPTLLLDIAGCIALCFGVYVYPIILWVAIMIARFVEELYVNDNKPLHNLANSMMTQIYIGIPLACAVGISYLFSRPEALLAVFLFLWINDTGAFLVGSTIGRHRLFERISPKKSWEGFFGGAAFTVAAALLFCYTCSGFFGFDNDALLWIGLAVVAVIFGTWGDLVESMIKRTLNIKDSGNIIPGHGGILDRIDSLLLAAPAVLIYLILWEVMRV